MASIVLALGNVGLAITVPSDGESFTEFFYLSEADDRKLLDDDYPRESDAMASPVVVDGRP